jgi:hypothetical protein
MWVLVENAAEAIASSYVEAGQLVRIGDLCGQWVQRRAFARPWCGRWPL